MEAYVSDPDSRAMFLACDGALMVFQAVVVSLFEITKEARTRDMKMNIC